MAVRAQSKSVDVVEWNVLLEKGGEMPEIEVDLIQTHVFSTLQERPDDPKGTTHSSRLCG